MEWFFKCLERNLLGMLGFYFKLASQKLRYQSIKFSQLHQACNQSVPEYSDIVYIIYTTLNIQETEQNLILKYRPHLKRYVQTRMDFLHIFALEEPTGMLVCLKNTPNICQRMMIPNLKTSLKLRTSSKKPSKTQCNKEMETPIVPRKRLPKSKRSNPGLKNGRGTQ